MKMSKKLAVAGTILAMVVFNWLYLPFPFNAGDSVDANPRAVDDSSLAAAILDANSRYKMLDNGTGRGWSTVHRIDAKTASRVESALRQAARRTGLPANYLAAYVQRESIGDPKAELRNRAQWEAAKDDRGGFAATDHGLVQISGRNLLNMFPDLTLEELKGKAEDIDFAINFLADYVVADLEWASAQDIDSMGEVAHCLVDRAKNPYWLAVLAYNRGRPGALRALSNPRACRYGDSVIAAWAENDAMTGVDPTSEPRPPKFPPLPPDDPYGLAIGDIQPHVEALQRLLNERLSLSPPLGTDGNFGPATREALIRFQRTRHLDATGATDTQTWGALMRFKSPGGPGAPQPLIMGNVSPHVANLQRLLNDRLVPGPSLVVDGDFGRATRDALIRFQRSREIAPTGAADAATWDALGGHVNKK